jgi:4-coumarate--CoA ligase
MPIESLYPPIDFRNEDIWELLFERRDREFPDDKGKHELATVVTRLV